MAPTQSPLISNYTESLHHLLSMVEAFKSFDSNNDGFVTAEELNGILSSIGYNASDSEIRNMMNGAPVLSMEDFLAMNARELDLSGFAGHLHAALLHLGMEDGDEQEQVITGEELHQAFMGGLGFEECKQIVEALDQDGDGSASLEDLEAIVQALL